MSESNSSTDTEQKRARRREYARQRSIKCRTEGRCRCGKSRREGYAQCAECVAGNQRDIKKRNAKRREKGLCLQCGRERTGKEAKCATCRQIAVRHLQKLKREVIAAYGGKCQCCGETEPAFLTIDHVNDDGASHRKAIGRARVYHWLKKHGYPKDGFQLLCFNCNCGRRVNGGVCPHISALIP